MKISDIEGKRYYHGSYDNLPVGTILSPRDNYESNWGDTLFYSVLESQRPDNMLAHRDAVFMVGDIDDIDLAGGATNYIFHVKPIGPVSRHDLNWSSQISMLVSDDPDNIGAIIEAAKNYWAGVPHPDES